MKKKMKKVSRRSSFEYRDDRSQELLEVFNREVGTRLFESVESVVRRVVDMPSSRFWVSEERAMRVVSAMLRGKGDGGCRALHREMYEEIARRCENLRREHPDWPLRACVWYVVNRPAPKFYLSAETAHTIIIKARKQCIRERMQRLQHWLSA